MCSPPIEEYAATATRVERRSSATCPPSRPGLATQTHSLPATNNSRGEVWLISLQKTERISSDERGAPHNARRSRGRATLQGRPLRVALRGGDKGPRPSKL